MKNFINNLLINLVLKTITIDNISSLIKRVVEWLLKTVDDKIDKTDKKYIKTKQAIVAINAYTSLLCKYYEDDVLTNEEIETLSNQLLEQGIVKESLESLINLIRNKTSEELKQETES